MTRLPRLIALSCAILLLPTHGAVAIEYWTEGRLRVERTTDLPNGREVDRFRLHGYAGFSGFSEDGAIEWGGALKLSTGDDSRADNQRNLDNESSSDVEVGELYVRWGGNWGTLEAGRSRSPLELTAMSWDEDFRPVGLSLRRDFEVRTFDRITLAAAYLAPRHIDESESRLVGLQAGYRWRDGAPTSVRSRLALLRFEDLGEVTREGRTRTNLRSADGRLASDFTILDLIIEARLTALGQPLLLTLDLARNLDAVTDQDDGARVSARIGRANARSAWEAGLAFQRIQQDAVMAAFNEDDWWFPTRMRGSRLWLAYGLTDDVSVRLAWFRERRDDLSEHVDRLLLDLLWNW